MSESSQKKSTPMEVDEIDNMNYVAKWLKQVKPESGGQQKPQVPERRSKRLFSKEMEESERLLVAEGGEPKKRKDFVPQSILKNSSRERGTGTSERSTLLQSPRFLVYNDRKDAQGSDSDEA